MSKPDTQFLVPADRAALIDELATPRLAYVVPCSQGTRALLDEGHSGLSKQDDADLLECYRDIFKREFMVSRRPQHRLLTDDQRAELIEKLSGDTFSSAHGDRGFLMGIITEGFRGFTKLSDDELLKAHVDAFDEEFAHETVAPAAPVLIVSYDVTNSLITFAAWSPEMVASHQAKIQSVVQAGARAAEFANDDPAIFVRIDGEPDKIYAAMEAATGLPYAFYEDLQERWERDDRSIVAGVVVEGVDPQEVLSRLKPLANGLHNDHDRKISFYIDPASYLRVQHTGDLLHELFDEGENDVTVLITEIRPTLDDALRLDVADYASQAPSP